ncbi:MAG: DUF748 domain-containing protein [Desulfuromonadaceae bacterium]|nr:DUF748 domain-containing protein [Desulfuromonadaceae bacterium]
MEENSEGNSWAKRLKSSKAFRRGVGIPAIIAVVLYVASFFLDEPLRSSMEQKMNRDLKGYSVRLPKLHVQLLGLSLTLKGVIVSQQAHPELPVITIPVLKASIHWLGIFSGRLVAEFMLDQPKININLQQLRHEAESKVPLKERGWQQVVEDIYPLKINTLKIKDASITYIDKDQKRPLILNHFNLKANNIRNIHLPDQVYPSSFHLDTAIFDTGHGTVDGAANFLAEPFPGIKGRLKLEKVPIDYFNTVIARSNISLHGGLLRATGDAEYSPKVKNVHLENLDIQGMNMDYIHTQRTAGAEKKRAVEAGKTAMNLTNKPGLLIRADRVSLTGCTLGMVNKAARRPYRIFLSDTDLQMSNFSNQFSQGTAKIILKAKFMGSGITTASANFRPEKEGPDLDLYVKIEESQLTAMNDLLRAYGDFDVSAGIFSLVTELHFKNGAISGYIKPFFKNTKVYDRRKDKDRGIFHQMYEKMIGGVAKILENRSHREVATKVDIKGKANKPETSSWQIVAELIKNAFFKAILPSFEKEVTGGGKR